MSHPNPQVKWLIESTVFEKQAENSLLTSLTNAHIDYKIVDGAEQMYGVSDFVNLFSPEDCVVVRGSIEFCGLVKRRASWIPGVYMTMKAYECTKYYPIFGNTLLNSEEYFMMPYGELSRKKDWLFDTVGIEDTIFIRPNRGNKIFTGKTVQKERFEKDLELLGFYNVSNDELCVVGRPYNVTTEFRFVVVDGRIVTGSQYKDVKGRLIDNPVETPEHNWWLPQQYINKLGYEPDRAWCIDMCMTKDGNYKVLEIGAFSCCGLYGCNTDKIVAAVSQAAKNEWYEEYYEV